jgi:hypothetical protein
LKLILNSPIKNPGKKEGKKYFTVGKKEKILYCK